MMILLPWFPLYFCKDISRFVWDGLPTLPHSQPQCASHEPPKDDEDDEVMFSWDLDFDSHDASITLDVENETVDDVNHTMERLFVFWGLEKWKG